MQLVTAAQRRASRRRLAAAGPALRELANKLLVFALVWVGVASRRRAARPWPGLVARLYRRHPYVVLFRLERLGYDLTVAAGQDRDGPRALLCDRRSATLPSCCLVALHGGMGMALAERLFGSLPRRSSAVAIGAAVDRFASLAGANVRPGYALPTWEMLGVYLGLFRTRLTPAAAARIDTLGAAVRSAVWHGIGRATYFRLPHLRPGGLAAALAACRREPPDAAARRDATTGLLLAVTLVNLRHPAVLEWALEQLAALLGPEDEGATVGIVTGVLARRLVTPSDPALAGLLRYQPRRCPARWARWVGEPVSEALTRWFPALEAAGRLPLLARHHSLTELAALAARPPEADGTSG